MITCPNCGEATSFEMRGSRRVYAQLNDDLEIDGWDEIDPAFIEWDVFEEIDPEPTGAEAIYCVSCDSAFTKEALRAGGRAD